MSDPFARLHSVVFDHAYVGRAAVYSVGSASVRIALEYDLSKWGESISVASGAAVLSVQKSEVPARPVRGSSFTESDGTIWLVDQVIESDQYSHKCMVVNP